MSFWSDITSNPVEILAIGAAIVAPELAPAIGESLGLTGTAASVAGSAIIGGTASAAGAAAAGKSGSQILKAAETGAAGGAVGGAVGSALPSGGTTLGAAEQGALSGAAGGITQGAIGGKQNLGESALTGAEIGGISAGTAQGISNAFATPMAGTGLQAQTIPTSAIGDYTVAPPEGLSAQGIQPSPTENVTPSGPGIQASIAPVYNADGSVNYNLAEETPLTGLEQEQPGLTSGQQAALKDILGFGLGLALNKPSAGAANVGAETGGTTTPTTGATTSPSEVTPAGGVEDTSTGGRRSNVWNLESLREGLGIS